MRLPRYSPHLAALCLFLLLLSGCALPGVRLATHHATPVPSNQPQPFTLTPGPLRMTPPPSGWYRVLNGETFSVGYGGIFGLTASLARPARLAACLLHQGARTPALPAFALSDDGGHTWTAHPITGMHPTRDCAIVADAQNPDTYVVGPGAIGTGIDPSVYMTTNAGQTWRELDSPGAEPIALNSQTTSLVADRLIAYLNGGVEGCFCELLPTGQWRPLDRNLPYELSQGPDGKVYNPPQTFAVDPANPAHIYAIMWTGPATVTLFVTTDDGATWRKSASWSNWAHGVTLWTVAHNQVFVANAQGPLASPILSFSADGATSWHTAIPRTLHSVAPDFIFVSPAGRVLTAAGAHLSALNPTTAALSPLATLPAFTAVFFCATATAAMPALICGDKQDIFGMPLPASAA